MSSLVKSKKLIPISQAAKLLGVSIDTVRRWDRSGLLHSDRANGKNRYFSIEEINQFKLTQPLSISEAAQKLKISATTLRRLEKRGLIKAIRNGAGERLYDKNAIREFQSSDYFLRKKQTLKGKPTQKPRTAAKKVSQNKSNKALKSPVQLKQPVNLDDEFIQSNSIKSWQIFSGLVGVTIIFILLTAIGLINIQVSTIQAAQPVEPSSPIITQTVFPLQDESVSERSELISLLSRSKSSTVSAEKTPALEEKTEELLNLETEKLIATVTAELESFKRNQTTATNSAALDALNRPEIVSVDSQGYHLKLPDGSVGFMPFKNRGGE